MIENVFVIMGLTYFVNQLFKKYDYWNAIEFLGSISDFKFLYKLTKCRFCLLFWIGVIWTIIMVLFDGFYWFDLLVPFISIGLISLLKKDGI